MGWLDLLLALFVVAGVLVVHGRALVTRDREELALAGLLDLGVGVLVVAALLPDSTYWLWAQEDAWIEWATAFAFLGSTVLAVLAAARAIRAGDRMAVVWNGLLALGCLVVAGEEISWGQRILGLTPPEVLLEANYQQELNVHNVPRGGRRSWGSPSTRTCSSPSWPPGTGSCFPPS